MYAPHTIVIWGPWRAPPNVCHPEACIGAFAVTRAKRRFMHRAAPLSPPLHSPCSRASTSSLPPQHSRGPCGRRGRDRHRHGTVHAEGGGVGGTTIDSFLNMLTDPDPMARRISDPYLLDPERAGRPAAEQWDGRMWPMWAPAVRAWTGPWPLNGVNGKIVRRSNALLGYVLGAASSPVQLHVQAVNRRVVLICVRIVSNHGSGEPPRRLCSCPAPHQPLRGL